MLSLIEQAEQAITQSTNEPAWLKAIRQKAWGAFETVGLPTAKTEDWKYTALKPLLAQQFEKASPLPTEVNVTNKAANLLVFIDGLFNQAQSRLSSSDIILKSFAEIFKEETISPLLSNHFTQYADLKSPGFNALNTVLMQDGAFISIPPNTVIKEPIQLLFINSGKPQNHTLRNLFILAPGAQVSIMETYQGPSDTVYLTHAVTEVVLEVRAQLTYYKIQDESKAAFHLHSLYAVQAKETQFKTINIDRGGKLVRNWLQSNLKGEHASADFAGLYVTGGSQYIDNHTRVEHLVPHTTSRELYKGILSDESRAVFNGQVLIAPQAQKSDATQVNRNIILSDKSEMDTKPQLEIYADDVKCSHGATVSSLSEDILFYLQSRGIAFAEAESMLLAGFMNEILQQVPS
jgi:Fe-S cluster assembly protein SufD